jgi:hypothetical protein
VNEKKTVTVAGVLVTVTVVGRELAVQVGRFDPQAAAGRLRVSSLSGTAAVAVYVVGEGGPDGAGERWVAGLYPAPPGAAEQLLLLCDGCFQAATGLLAGCQDGCPHGDPGHDGLCLRDGPSECRWCGTQGRLREVPRAGVERRLSMVGEEGEGLWWLHFTGGSQGPFPRPRRPGTAGTARAGPPGPARDGKAAPATVNLRHAPEVTSDDPAAR